MKKSSRFSLFEIRRITLLAISVAALLLGRPTFAGNVNVAFHTLDITENSSTSLTVLFDLTNVTASAVALNSSDNWTLTFDPSIQFSVFNNFWLEPDDPNFVNVVFNNGPTASNVLLVISDNPNTGSAVADGIPQQQNISVNGQPGFVNITFHDKGDGPVGVPESGSTLALLFLSLAGLLGVRRFPFGRFA